MVTAVRTEHFLDTVHLNRSVAAAISQASFTPDLSTQKPLTFAQRQQAKHRLADSMARRAECEVRTAQAKYGKDVVRGKTAVDQTIAAIILCYQGNHALCKKHSLICDGKNVHYEYLPTFSHGAFWFSRKVNQLLTAALTKRMGIEALRKTRFGFTTQKAESTNHAFSTTNPKHSMTFSRNGVNRDHSAIHMVNNFAGDSILIKNRACGVPLSPNSLCLRALLQMNKRQTYHRLRSRSKSFRLRRAHLRRRRYNMYDITRNESCYSKGQLDPK